MRENSSFRTDERWWPYLETSKIDLLLTYMSRRRTISQLEANGIEVLFVNMCKPFILGREDASGLNGIVGVGFVETALFPPTYILSSFLGFTLRRSVDNSHMLSQGGKIVQLGAA